MYVFFGLQRPFSFNTCVSPIRRFGWPCAQCVSLKLHAMSMRPYTTVWMTARTVRTVIRTVVSCFLTRASMGKSNYYDKMKWQDSIKVIITQKLHQIRNWEFQKYYTKLETENFTICWMECPLSKWLKISNTKIWPKIGWYDGSDDRRRYVHYTSFSNCVNFQLYLDI